jgi:hypothetical protein
MCDMSSLQKQTTATTNHLLLYSPLTNHSSGARKWVERLRGTMWVEKLYEYV